MGKGNTRRQERVVLYIKPLLLFGLLASMEVPIFVVHVLCLWAMAVQMRFLRQFYAR